ncbi:MAG: Zn-ribbon domain-containing OB-fold protein [Anaerolineales bacterium]|nr:Zn-ribbon domain-containing OB-fold protein [Anaerolineales bacterium]
MDIPRNWRLQGQRYRLEGNICDYCEKKVFPGRDICPQCGKKLTLPYTFSGFGKVYAFTHLSDVPEGYDDFAPYALAIIELDEGPRVTAQLTDLGDVEIEIGMPVEVVTRRLRSATDERGMLIYGYKFRPVLKTE